MCEALFYTSGYGGENGRHSPRAQGAYTLWETDRQCAAANKITSGRSKCCGETKTECDSP